MGRSVKTDPKAGLSQDPGREVGHRPLPVGPGDLENRIGLLGPADRIEQPMHAIQIERPSIDPMVGPQLVVGEPTGVLPKIGHLGEDGHRPLGPRIAISIIGALIFGQETPFAR